MLSLTRFYLGIILVFSLLQSLHAQIPDSLKQPYWDLVKLNNSRQYQAAILQGKILVTQAPMFPYTYGQLALTFEKAERLEQGQAFFDSLRQQSPDHPYVYYAIAMLEKRQKNFEQAVGNLKVCIKLDPQYASAYMQLAEIYNEQKDLDAAENYFQILMQEEPLNAAIHYGLGCIYTLKKERAKGTEAFARSLEINPELIHAYFLKGRLHSDQKDYQKAFETWDKGKEVAAKWNDVEMQGWMTGNAGKACHDLDQFQKSFTYQDEALKLAREIGDKQQELTHLTNRGSAYKSLGQPNKAIQDFELARTIAKEIDDKISQDTLLMSMSGAYHDISKYKPAIEYAKEALKAAEARGDSLTVASCSQILGSAHRYITHYPEALKYSNRALRIRRMDEDLRGVCNLLNNIGVIYKDMGEIATAIDTFNVALQIARIIPSKSHELQILGSLGYAHSGWSDYTQANYYFQEALSLAGSLDDMLYKGVYLGNIGVIYKKWGNFTQAKDYLGRALKHDLNIKHLPAVVRHYVNLANISEICGDYLKALDLNKKALGISDSIGTRNYSAVILGNMGVVYSKIGDDEQALRYYEKALKLAREIPVKGSIPRILTNIGNIYERMANFPEALEKLNEALQLSREMDDKEGQVQAFISIGVIYERQKNTTKALNTYHEALVLAKKIDNHHLEGELYLNLGNIHSQRNDLSQAKSLFQKALAAGRAMEAFYLMHAPLAGIAAIAEKQKRYDEALKHYGQAIDKIESVRERLKIESYKTQFVEDKLEIYESVITLLIRLGRFEEAYDYLQRFRSRSFLEILSPQRLDFAEGISRRRFARYRFWEQKLREIYDRLGVEYAKGESKRSEKMIAALNDSLQRVQREHEKICDEIRLHHPRAAEAQGLVQPLDLKGVQQKVLQQGQTLVEYFVGPEMVAIYVIQADTFHCEVLKIKRQELEDWIVQLRAPFKQVKEGKIRNLADVPPFDLKLAQQLYEKLFQSLEKYIGPNTQLLIVPDGVLHYLPFEALVTGVENKRHDLKVIFSRFENVHYLVEKYAITYLPAASVAAYEKPDKTSDRRAAGRLLAFGSPDFGRFTDSSAAAILIKASKGLLFAPLSDRDVREVALIMQPADTFFKREATEDRFKQEVKESANIYLSTHAIANESQPMYSLIAFAQDDDPKEDGFLHTYEVFNLKLNADLVTLSACETGLGELSRGEGLIGLTRAFMYAGASSVLVSLWSVDESTAALMKIFYQNLKDGMSKAEALQRAKLKLIRTRENGISFAHPFLWAPFVLVGEGT